MKINEYNQMMSYLTRPAETSTRDTMMAGGPTIKFMIDFIIRNAPKVSKVGSKISREFLEKMSEVNPENIKNVYRDVEAKLALGGKFKDDVKKGEAPKTDVEKVRAQKKSFDETEKELAKEGQIPVKDQTDPNTLTTEQLIEFRKTNRAGKGQFTNAEAIIARLENTLKDIKPDDETYEYVTTTFPNFIKELKANPKLAENENVWNSLMSELPSDQRFVKYDDGTVDFQTKKTTHNFKLREDLDTDRKGPNVPDDDPNMFDDMFDRMQKEMQDYIPGEEPLTKKKRTLNAEGGVIGGGMIEGEDLGSRTGFKAPYGTRFTEDLKKKVVELAKQGKSPEAIMNLPEFEGINNARTKIIAVINQSPKVPKKYKFIADARGQGFTFGQFDKIKKDVVSDFNKQEIKNIAEIGRDRFPQMRAEAANREVRRILQEAGARDIPKPTEARQGPKTQQQLERDVRKEKLKTVSDPSLERSLTGNLKDQIEFHHADSKNLNARILTTANRTGYISKADNEAIRPGDALINKYYEDRAKLLKKKPKGGKALKKWEKEWEAINKKGMNTVANPKYKGLLNFKVIDPITFEVRDTGLDESKMLMRTPDPDIPELYGQDNELATKPFKEMSIQEKRQLREIADRKYKDFKTKKIKGPKLYSGFDPTLLKDIVRDIAKSPLGKAKIGADITAPIVGTYVGYSPKEIALDSVTAGFGTLVKDQADRYEYAKEKGFGDQYLKAREKLTLASNFPNMNVEKSAFALTDDENYAFNTLGGEFDQTRELERAQRAEEYAKIREETPALNIPGTGILGLVARSVAPAVIKATRDATPTETNFYGLPLETMAGTPRTEFSTGGKPKDKRGIKGIETKLPIDPNMPQDPGRRNFLEKMGIGSLGIGALMTGAVKFAPEAVKAVKKATPDFSSTNVPMIVEELYSTIKNFGKQTDYPKPGSGNVKYEMGPYKMEEGPGGYNITKTNEGEYSYSEEYFGVYKDPETGAIEYEELTVKPDMDGKLKDVDYGVDAQTYREIGEDLSKTTGQDVYKVIAEEDIKGVLDDGGVIMDQGVLKSGK